MICAIIYAVALILFFMKAIQPPDGLEINALIDSTERAFSLIIPWCKTFLA